MNIDNDNDYDNDYDDYYILFLYIRNIDCTSNINV